MTFFEVSMRCYAQRIDTIFPEMLRLTPKKRCSAGLLIR
jgi:hypothetical protein